MAFQSTFAGGSCRHCGSLAYAQCIVDNCGGYYGMFWLLTLAAQFFVRYKSPEMWIV